MKKGNLILKILSQTKAQATRVFVYIFVFNYSVIDGESMFEFVMKYIGGKSGKIVPPY